MTINVEMRLNVEKILQAIETGAREGLDKTALTVTDSAKSLAPVGETANLRRSIIPGPSRGEYLNETLEGSVQVGVPYGTFVEFGTGSRGELGGSPFFIEPKRRQALRFAAPGGNGFLFSKGHFHPGAKSKPFLRPAAERNVTKIESDLRAAIENAIDRLA